MTEQEAEVIETELQKMAARAEKRVVDGEMNIMSAEERAKLREAVAERGWDLSVFQVSQEARSRATPDGVGRSSRQADELIKVCGGMDNFIAYCQEMLMRCVSANKKESAEGFVAEFVATYIDEGYIRFPKDSDLLKNRLEAIVSATNSVLELVAQISESEALDVEGSECFSLSVRERVLRGWEKAGAIVPRSKAVERTGGKIIRTLPVAGLKRIIEYFAEG